MQYPSIRAYPSQTHTQTQTSSPPLNFPNPKQKNDKKNVDGRTTKPSKCVCACVCDIIIQEPLLSIPLFPSLFSLFDSLLPFHYSLILHIYLSAPQETKSKVFIHYPSDSDSLIGTNSNHRVVYLRLAIYTDTISSIIAKSSAPSK